MDPSPRTIGPTSANGDPQPARAGGYGPLLFARYAYPPNAHGYCGPPDHHVLLEYGSQGFVDPRLIQLERSFHGAWPYLTLIAEVTGIDNPLDHRVVEAYWLGNRLLDDVAEQAFGRWLEQRFRGSAEASSVRLAEVPLGGGRPHHSFHVFCIYPWAGLLRGQPSGGQPLRVLDRCRIRPGQVVSIAGDEVRVRSRPLRWDGSQLSFGGIETETVACADDGRGFVPDLRPGDLVALHWDWVCDRITRRQLTNLVSYTGLTLRVTNDRLRRSTEPARTA